MPFALLAALGIGCPQKTPQPAPPNPAPAPEPEPAPALDLTLVPGTRLGPLQVGATRADVVASFGDAVNESTVDVGEGQTVPGLTVFADVPAQTASFVLDGDVVSEIRLARGATAWSVSGIHIGDPLATVVEANDGPLTLLGFGWDYAGTVIDAKDGALEPFDGQLILRLAPPAGTEVPASLNGDRPIASDDPQLVDLDPIVYEIIAKLGG